MPARHAVTLLASALFALGAPAASAATYDYAPDPAQPHVGVRVWVPDGVPTVMGVLVVGNGGSGDARPAVDQPFLRAWGRHYGFAVLATSAVREQTADIVTDGLADVASRAGRPELAHAPVCAFGGSNGGRIAFGVAKLVPDRTIAFAMNKAGEFDPNVPEAALKVPAVLIAGQYDLGRRTRGLRDLVAHYRGRGARWVYVEEQGVGHEGALARPNEVILGFFDRMIAARYPKDASPAAGPVALVELPENRGILMDPATMHTPGVRWSAFGDHPGDRAAAGWVPDLDAAFLVRTLATWDKPLLLSASKAVREPPALHELQRDNTADAVFAPGERVEFALDAFAAPRFTRFEFYAGARKVGETRDGATTWATTELPPGVHVVSALGYLPDGRVVPSSPAKLIVTGGPGTVFPPPAETAPTIVAHPRDVTVPAGGVAVLEAIAAAPAGPVRYQWRHDGRDLPGEAHPTLRLTNLRPDHHAGAYTLWVTTPLGRVVSAPATVTVTPFVGVEAAYAAVAPAIDGAEDAAWATATAYPLTHVVRTGDVGPPTDLGATVRALWDLDNLYVRIDVPGDRDRAVGREPIWDNDRVEVYLDGPNAKRPYYSTTEFQYVGSRDGRALIEVFNKRLSPGTALAAVERRDGGGYAVELRVPSPPLGVNLRQGTVLGFDAHANDADPSGKRRAKVAWHATTDNAWEQPGNLGTLKLVGGPPRPSPPAAAGPATGGAAR